MKGAVYTLCFALCIALVYSQTKAKPTAKPKPTTPKPTVAPAALKCRVYNVTVKITNQTHTDDLVNPYSADYNKLKLEMEAGVFQAFDGYGPFRALKVNSFSKAADGKTNVEIYLEMKSNSTAHLGNLIAQLAKGKLGAYPAGKKLVYAGCYYVPPIQVCSYGCPTICAPSCSTTCCNQYAIPAPPVVVPAPPPPPPPPPPPSCPAPCHPACAPSCTPACCNTGYLAGPYGKREHAPKPKKEDMKKLKKHLLKKHHKSNKH
ncbi:protein stoned-B [Exaiptasia diaphana]|uniref:SEA domain-containing protein n=1 Tax=Exaiptasia diaphana TaxID=2652724 RepID=A0A913YQL1_EXADI|nr:protein stoned-B [Exaiptasia diaphana]